MKKIIFTIAFVFLGLHVGAEEKYITTSDGVKLYVNIKGSGTPCLYIHGGPGSGSYWVEKFFGDFLESKYTMVYLDQRGVGRSSGDHDQDYSLERMALDFEEVRKALGFDSWLTLGHSFGGVLQMGYVEKYPESTKGMIMVNCTLNLTESFCESWSPKASEFTGIIDNSPCESPKDITSKLWNHINNLREKDLFWKMGFSVKENEKMLDATYNEIPNWNGSFSNLAFGIEEFWQDFKVKTSTTEVPVLFFYGTKDWMVGPNHYKGINFPNQMLWKYEGGHIPFMENKEELKQAILAFSATNNF